MFTVCVAQVLTLCRIAEAEDEFYCKLQDGTCARGSSAAREWIIVESDWGKQVNSFLHNQSMNVFMQISSDSSHITWSYGCE